MAALAERLDAAAPRKAAIQAGLGVSSSVSSAAACRGGVGMRCQARCFGAAGGALGGGVTRAQAQSLSTLAATTCKGGGGWAVLSTCSLASCKKLRSPGTPSLPSTGVPSWSAATC